MANSTSRPSPLSCPRLHPSQSRQHGANSGSTTQHEHELADAEASGGGQLLLIGAQEGEEQHPRERTPEIRLPRQELTERRRKGKKKAREQEIYSMGLTIAGLLNEACCGWLYSFKSYIDMVMEDNTGDGWTYRDELS